MVAYFRIVFIILNIESQNEGLKFYLLLHCTVSDQFSNTQFLFLKC